LTATLLLAALIGLAPGYRPAMTAAGMAHWESWPVPYRVNAAGSDDVVDGSDLAAVRASFDAWSHLPCSDFAFRFDGLTNETTTGGDAGSEGVNLVVWRELLTEWVADGNSPLYYAVTTLSFEKCSGALVDADIEVNGGNNTWTTDPEHVSVDVQNVLTHEVGHVLGLDHSSDANAVMYARAAAGETSKRTLTQDDIDGACYLYPKEGDPPWLEQSDGCATGCSAGCRRPAPGSTPALLLGVVLLGARRVRRAR
jgi:hypothetical protein